MDGHNAGEGYSNFQESYGVVPSNSEYHQPPFRSVVASAPPILESESQFNSFSAHNLIQVRRQRRNDQNASSDPLEIRVQKLRQIPQKIRESAENLLPPQAVLIKKRKLQSKQENALLPTLTRRRATYESKKLELASKIENTIKVLPSIPSNTDISIDVDLGSTLPDDVMHFIKSAKLRRGEALIGELNHQHTQRLSAMSVSAARYGIRNDDILLKSLLTHDALPDLAKISDTDFVYGICRGKMRCYNPYDLKIVQYSDIPSDSIFYTINSENIMMTPPNGDDPTITPIDAWVRERAIFLKIIKMRTFRQVRIWNSFNHWLRGCSQRRLEKRGLSLHRSLFTMDDRMRGVLFKVQEFCEAAASSSDKTVNIGMSGDYFNKDGIHLIAIDITKTFTLDQYIHHQKDTIQTAKDNLLKLRTSVLELATSVCFAMGVEAGMEGQYTETIKESEKALAEKRELEDRHVKLEKIFGNKDYYADIVMLEDKKHAHKKQLRDVSLPTYTDMQEWKQVIGQLSRFLRLIDCLLLSLLRRLCGRAISLLRDHLKLAMDSGVILHAWQVKTTEVTKGNIERKHIAKMRKQREKKEKMLEGIMVEGEDNTEDDFIPTDLPTKPDVLPPLLDITLVLTPTYGLSLSPSKDACSSAFSDITFNIKDLVAEFGSILHDSALTPFCTRVKFEYVMESEPCPFESWEGQYVNMQSVDEDVVIKKDCAEILDLLHTNIDTVWEKAKPFKLYCGMVEECVKLKVKESMDESEWNTDQFKFVLAKHHEQVEAMQELPESVREGLMMLQIQPFRESTLPYPLQILAEVNERLPVIAYKRNEDLLINIKNATHRLEKTCKDVSDFVVYLSFMTKLLVELPGMEKEFGLIAKMYAVADEFDVPLPPEELALYRTLLPSFSHLKATLTYSEATKDDLIKKYSKDLEEQISNLLDDLKTLKDQVRHSNVLSDDISAAVALETIRQFHKKYEKYSEMAHRFMDYQGRFGSSLGRQENPMSKDSFSSSENTSTLMHFELSECERDIRLRKLLWENLTDWKAYMSKWSGSSFHTIDVLEIQKTVKHMTQTIMLLEKALPVNNILPCLKIGVEDFKQSLPLLVSLRNPVLKARHLADIETLTGINVIQDPLCTVAKVLESSYFEQRSDISKISIQASNEATLEGMLQKVIEIWKRTEFTLVPYRDHPDMVVLSGVDDVQIALEESLVTVATIKGSRFVCPIQEAVDEWDRRLELFSVTLDEWITCQRNWMYLESILTTPDIQRQLPREARLFSQVDKSWKELMRKVQERSNAIWAATTPGVLETLQANNANLDKILKCLEDYLETKRLVFSRFYFLSNDDILSILSNSKNPASVQSKLTKCFGNIKKLIITKEANASPSVKGLMSGEGETLDLIRVLRVRGNVEVWMGQVETAMFEVVRYTIKGAMMTYMNEPYHEWWKSNSGQVIILVSQIIWNQLIEDAFYKDRSLETLKELHNMWVEKLNLLSQNVSSNMASWQRLALESLLTIEVHARDIIEDLLEKEIESSDDFEWTRHLRYSFDDIRDTVMIRQNNSVFEYGFEYLGSTSRLVITPLTDRCFLTLTTALHLHLGGAPGGPAGTGKTETVKDLSKGFGKQCVVFNCSEGLDFRMLARFFSGLTQSGSWCCFDEFNRIDLEVLSVVAQQLQILKRAKDAHLSRCVFEGHEIRVNPTCGFFITMNPGYAGRVELPDNLKSLFRPVAMTMPDFGLIIEVILFSEGFLSAGDLSSKLVQLYLLASRQLSQQHHYDFGMRAIKAVLHVAGEMRRNKVTYSHIDDTTLLLQAVFDASLPKFIAEDVPLFMGIVEDLFPNYKKVDEDTTVLKNAIKEALKEQLLLVTEVQVAKTLQLYNTMLVRHGVMQVGGTSGGKTTSRMILAHALAKLANTQPLFNQNTPPAAAVKGNCFHTLNCHCVNKENMVKMEVESSSRKRERKKTAKFFQEALVSPQNVEILSKALGLNSRYAHHRNINRQTRNRANSIMEMKQKSSQVNDGIKCMTLNPKCVSLEKLYGQFDKDSYEWADGILATIIRRFAKESVSYQLDSSGSRGNTAKSRISNKSRLKSGAPTPESTTSSDTPNSAAISDIAVNNWKWLILDGPVDPVWVENLNTVLDDTRTLCLANGERVPLLPRMRIMFEVDDLSYASPATISRCGMVYMDPVQLGWRPYVERWKHDLPSNLPKTGKNFLASVLEMSVDAGLEFLKTQTGQIPVPVPDISVVKTLCSLILAHLNIVSENGGFGNLIELVSTVALAEDPGAAKNKTLLQRHPAQLLSFLSKMYLFCYVTAFGSILEGDSDMDDSNLESHDSQSQTTLGGHTKQSLMKIWGSQPDLSARASFDLFVRDFFDLPAPYGVRLPSGVKSVFCYYFDIDSGLFSQWDCLLPQTKDYVEDVKTGFEQTGGSLALANAWQEVEMPIPTIDSIRLARIMELLLLGNAKILVCGHAGIGKSVIIDAILKRINKKSIFDKDRGEVHLYDIAGLPAAVNTTLADNIQEWIKPDSETEQDDYLFGNKKEFIYSRMLMNGQTTAGNVQAFFERNVIKLGRDLMGPPIGKTLVMFVEDLNMPLKEQFGAQPPLEFLRQFIGNDGFYDINRYNWKSVDEVTLVATCTVSGRVPVNIPSRLLQYFSVINMPTPSLTTTQHILEAKLGRYYIINSFPDEVQRTVGSLCTAGLYLYQQVLANFKPKPSRLHYMFNMHSLRQFYLGMMGCTAADLTSQDAVVRLYVHETTRVFCDKLSDEQEKERFIGYLVDSMQKYFKELATKMVFTKRHVSEARIMFADFHIQLSSEETVRRYRIVPDGKQLIQTLTDLQNRFNVSESEDYRLVFFYDAVQHLLRLCRAVRHKGLHVIQLGVGGTGRASSARLATFIAASSYHELNIRRNYTIWDLRDDLKAILIKCGSQKKLCTLYISELHILQDEFMCDIEALMEGGCSQVEHWFDNEEKEFIISAMKNRQDMVQDNSSNAQIWSIFMSNIHACLHVVISISPTGTNFKRYCRMHPTILSNSFIDFYSEWPQAALLAVANTFFKQNQLDKIIANTKTVAQTGLKGETLNPALARAYGHMTEEERDQFKAIKDKLAPVCVQVHMFVQSVITEYKVKANRHFHITPSSYLELLQHFLTMLKKQNKHLSTSRQRLVNGIKALNMSSNMIERMSEELIALEPQLEHKAKLTQQLMQKLEEEKISVDLTKHNVSKEEGAVHRENVRIGKIAAEAESDLAAALPSLEGAIEALDALDKQDISEIRVYNSPPEMVRKVMEAVCVLLKEKPSWSNAKQLLGDQGLLKRLTNFDKDNLPLKSLGRLQQYTENPDFTPDNVGKISVACKSMCMWVIAIENYAKVYRYVLPKKERFQESMEHLKSAQTALKKKQEQLQMVQEQLTSLQNKYNNTKLDRDKLQNRILQTKKRLDRANVLIEALSGERERWSKLVEGLNLAAPSLMGDTLISTAAMVYIGPFTQVYRERLWNSWIDICVEKGISVSKKDYVSLLSAPIEVQKWYTQGLPRDHFSTENAVLLMNCHRWPLLIDPQGQGKQWLLGMEKDNLAIIPFGSLHMLTDIENAIRLGSSVLLEGVPDYIDVTLYPILNRRQCEQTGVVSIVDIDIEYNKDFRLYMSTSLSNPEFPPEDCIKMTLINFTVTFSGLQQQLLNRVVKMERPWLEQQNDALLKQLFEDNLQLRNLEDEILETLSTVQADILDDQDLVSTLDKCKKTAREIQVRVSESVQMQNKIESTRKKYLPVATRGTIIYFIMSDLTLLNCMYNFSLEMFMNVFKTTVHSLGNSYLAPDQEDDVVLEFSFNTANRDRQLDFKVEKHVDNLVDHITMNLHKQVVSALYSKHHLVYSMLVCVQVLRNSGNVSDNEWDVFLHGGTLKLMSKSSQFVPVMEDDILGSSISKSSSSGKRLNRMKSKRLLGKPSWMSTSQWEACNMIENTLPPFLGLTKNMTDKPEFWQAMLASQNPYYMFEQTRSRSSSVASIKSTRADSSLDLISEDSEADIHSISSSHISETRPNWKWSNLSSFQKLMLIKVLRMDALMESCSTFVSLTLGDQFIASQEQSLNNLYKKSKPQYPILFILSPGVDPTTKLQRLLKDLNENVDMLEMLSLGRGQGPRIEEILRNAMQRGKWVFLQNCHLGHSWLKNLEKVVHSMQTESLHQDFRLWLSSMPDELIPGPVIQRSIKVALEQPRGVKANLHQAFISGIISPSMYSDEDVGPNFRKLVYNLCLFNSVILERKKYGSLGWNIPYEFTNSDLEACIQVLHQLMSEYVAIPWDALLQLAGTVMYGGRVTDKWDQRTLSAILSKFFNEAAIQHGYRFTTTESYQLPSDLSIEETLTYISSLPNYDNPELFGMHHNADKTYNEHSSREIVNFLLYFQPSYQLDGGFSNKDSLVMEFLIHVHKTLPTCITGPPFMDYSPDVLHGALGGAERPPSVLFEKGYLKPKVTDISACTPMQNVVRHEVRHFNRLLDVIQQSLRTLAMCLQGDEAMTSSIDEMYQAILDNKLPAAWKEYCTIGHQPLARWVESLANRINFMQYWIDLCIEGTVSHQLFGVQYSELAYGQEEVSFQDIVKMSSAYEKTNQPDIEKLPRSFWLSALFFPQGLLTAVLQTYSRKHGIPIDSLTFGHVVSPLSPQKEEEDKLRATNAGLTPAMWAFPGPDVPEEGILVHELYLDGGRWDGNNVVEALPGKQVIPLPEIQFLPMQVGNNSTTGVYECPIYRTSERCGTLDQTGHSDNYVTSIDLPSEQTPQHWVTRGLAIICQSED